MEKEQVGEKSNGRVKSWLLRALADLEIMEVESAEKNENYKTDTITIKWK